MRLARVLDGLQQVKDELIILRARLALGSRLRLGHRIIPLLSSLDLIWQLSKWKDLGHLFVIIRGWGLLSRRGHIRRRSVEHHKRRGFPMLLSFRFRTRGLLSATTFNMVPHTVLGGDVAIINFYAS